MEGSRKELILGEEQINKCLTTKRIGFDEISQITAGDVFRKATENEVFTVPNENLKILYEDHSMKIGRKDLKFIVGE